MPVELSEKKPEDFDPEDLREDFARDCDMGNADACFNLGEWHQVVKRDYIKAGNVFEKNCNEKQNGNSCFGLGALYAAGKGRERDFKRARELFSKACSLGHTRGCDIHGATCLDTSNGAPKDIPGAEKSYTAACAREYAPSCYRLGLMHLTGQLAADKKPDPVTAHKFMKRACELGAPNGCHTVAVMYKKGDGVTQDERKFKYYRDLTLEIVKATGATVGTKTSTVSGM